MRKANEHQNIELVLDGPGGRVLHCFALDANGERGPEIPIKSASEHYDVMGPLEIRTFRVKRTEQSRC